MRNVGAFGTMSDDGGVEHDIVDPEFERSRCIRCHWLLEPAHIGRITEVLIRAS